MSALDTQVGGGHYKSMPIQPMEFSMANKMDACQHTIIKYVSRFREKGGIQDLEKAKHVIDMLIEFESKKSESYKVTDPFLRKFQDGQDTPLSTKSDRNIDLMKKAQAAADELTGISPHPVDLYKIAVEEYAKSADLYKVAVGDYAKSADFYKTAIEKYAKIAADAREAILREAAEDEKACNCLACQLEALFGMARKAA